MQMISSYVDRNGQWLRPLFAALILAVSPGIAAVAVGPSLPAWFVVVGEIGALIALVVCGVYATFTDTLSARIMRFLAQIVAISLAVLWLLEVFAR